MKTGLCALLQEIRTHVAPVLVGPDKDRVPDVVRVHDEQVNDGFVDGAHVVAEHEGQRHDNAAQRHPQPLQIDLRSSMPSFSRSCGSI